MTAYQFFVNDELKCKCGCEGQAMDDDFMNIIEQMRAQSGFPYIVSSAYRCPAHNHRVSTTGFNGPHTTGKAIDLLVYHGRAHKVVELALKFGIHGIGVSQKGKHSSRFIHLDNARDEYMMWSY